MTLVVVGAGPTGVELAAAIAEIAAHALAKDFRRIDTSVVLVEGLGRSAAVAEFGRIRLSGFVAWVLWWAVHIALLIGFRSRALVMFGWGWSWLTFRRGARLITSRWQPAS